MKASSLLLADQFLFLLTHRQVTSFLALLSDNDLGRLYMLVFECTPTHFDPPPNLSPFSIQADAVVPASLTAFKYSASIFPDAIPNTIVSVRIHKQTAAVKMRLRPLLYRL